jgi:ABC-type microcin C transport system duplicated ATPase subunit YejF
VAAGSIRFDGRELVGLAPAEMQSLRGNAMAMIFQEPMTSLNPVFTVGEQIVEVLSRHRAGWRGRRPSAQALADAGAGAASRRPSNAVDELPAPALGRHAPARHDRHGAGLQARSC